MLDTHSTLDVPRSPERNLRETLKGLVVWGAGSGVLVAVYASSFWSKGFLDVVSIFGHGALIAIAFSSVGSLIGFLFGIPRTLQSASPVAPKVTFFSTSVPATAGGDS